MQKLITALEYRNIWYKDELEALFREFKLTEAYETHINPINQYRWYPHELIANIPSLCCPNSAHPALLRDRENSKGQGRNLRPGSHDYTST